MKKMSVLEDLWFDNLVVNDAEIKKGSEAERVLSAVVRSDNALEGTLTEKQKEQFQNGKDLSNQLLTVLEKDAFVRGFKLGARMAAEVLSDE